MPTNGPIDSETPATLVLGGAWLSPKADAHLTSHAVTLSAKPTASGPGATTFTEVVFWATWTGSKTTGVCTATKPSDKGAWTCTADLLSRGVPPGPVSFSFDVHGVGVSVARSPAGPRDVTYAVPPPKPLNARWKEIGTPTSSGEEVTRTYRVRWEAPAGYADEFIMYETWECPRYSKRNDGTPCFVAGTPVDTSKLQLWTTARGDARSVKVSETGSEGCGPLHGSILLRARNAFGNSAFAIVEATQVDWQGPGEVIC